ncbi:MAG: hypothetical protein K2K41_07085 [Ruminiclostridium sp.]|nr:hypothetical protein [Ruminiclostridium sp.]
MSLNQEENTKWKKAKRILISVWVIALIVSIVLTVSSGDLNKETTKTCGVCHKTYNSSSENGRSIARTRMCKKCYASFEAAQGALNELPVH